MRKLQEGMRGGDLEDLVLPLVSVDEYKSKIDDEAVVIAFYVQEHGAAEDLNRFVQRSPVEILDSEISPAPDQNGYFMVFVELLQTTQFAQNVASLLDEIAPLANINGWKMQVRGHDKLAVFDQDELGKAVNELNREADPIKESIRSFLTPSVLRDVELVGDTLVLEGASGKHQFKLVGFGPTSSILEQTGLSGVPVDMGFGSVSGSIKLVSMLGENWTVNRVGGCDVLQRLDSDHALVIK